MSEDVEFPGRCERSRFRFGQRPNAGVYHTPSRAVPPQCCITRMGGIPATNESARGITSTPVPLDSSSWFYPVGAFATENSCHDVQNPTASRMSTTR